MRKYLATVFVAALTALVVVVSLHVTPAANATLLANQASYRRTGNNPFTSGGSLTHTDMNAQFDALVTVIDGNLDATNIANSIEALWPRAWAIVTGTCTTGTCTIAASQGVSSITWSSAGDYLVNLSTTRANTNYATIATAGNGVADNLCQAGPNTTSQVLVRCLNPTTGTETNGPFSVLILDD